VAAHSAARGAWQTRFRQAGTFAQVDELLRTFERELVDWTATQVTGRPLTGVACCGQAGRVRGAPLVA
jgi:hypothetical protein